MSRVRTTARARRTALRIGVVAGIVAGVIGGGIAGGIPGFVGPANAGRPALAVAQERTLPVVRGGTQVRQRTYTLHGVPVRRAYATIVADAGGARVVDEVLPSEAPELLPAGARLGAAEAVELARDHLKRGPVHPSAEGPGTLVYIVILGVPVLAYEVDMALDLDGPEPSKKTVWISADSGIVLDEWEHVRASKARVFLTNPAKTPDPIVVDLSGVHATEAGQPLVGDRVQSYDCSLEPQDPETLPAWWKEGKCYPVHRALSNADGDFFVKMPDIIFPADNADNEDAYAELSMYWHAERFLDRMAALGVPEFKCELSTMLANYVDPKLSPSYPDLDYTPLNNAYWTNTCEPDKGVTMIFGQGSDVDFGYDGDVVYHELGHGMVSLLTPDGLGARTNRSDAQLADAGGLNEAIADYFSVMLTSDPNLGDYVARFWPGYGEAIRTAENSKTCPDDTIGQVHNDGEPFMAALWATRTRVGGEKLDPLVIDMLTRLPIDVDLETASWTVLELAEDAGWSASEMDTLIRAFDTRGLYDCPRVIVDPTRVSAGRTMYLRPKGAAVTPFFPGPMQLRHEVPVGSDNIVVRFRAGENDEVPDSPTGVVVLLKREDARIAFTYTLTALDRAPDGSKPSVREVIAVAGDWDHQFTASLLGTSDNQLVLRGFRPGEIVHVALGNQTSAEIAASGVAVLSLPTEFLDEGKVDVDADLGDTDTDSDSEAAGDAGIGSPELMIGGAESSCACRADGKDRGLAGMMSMMSMVSMLLALLGIARRRR